MAEGDWPQSKGVAILSFQSLREAELWKDSVPEIRQQDWLDGVDMIIAPVRSMPRTITRVLYFIIGVLQVDAENLRVVATSRKETQISRD